MQYHPVETNIKTIEGTLFEAFVKAGVVSADNADDPFKIGLQRAARTDSGVHALGNVVSAQLIVLPNMVETINSFLPPTIRVWGVTRVQNGFNAHSSCEGRYYNYTFPTYLLRPPALGTFLHAHINGLQPDSNRKLLSERVLTVDDDASRLKYRVKNNDLERFRDLLSSYIGSRMFHNFTPDILPGDKTSRRQIFDINASDPFVRGGIEWVKVIIHGQSFMMHQIRKMMGTIFLAARTNTPNVVLRALMDRRAPGRTHTVRAPAAGLILERPLFDGYNHKLATERMPNATVSDDVRFDAFKHKMETFREEWVWPGMLEAEPMFAQWMHAVDDYDGPDISYLGPRGAAQPDDPPVDTDMLLSTTSFMEPLPGPDQRVRFLYVDPSHEKGYAHATIPTHGPGWRDRRFLDHIVDIIARARMAAPIGDEAVADARAEEGAPPQLPRYWEETRARASAFHRAQAGEEL